MRKGKEYEDTACAYLESVGYRILYRNYHCRFGEIDIVALDGDRLVFIEVKGSERYEPIERVDNIKLKRLKKCMEMFLSTGEYQEIAFEVVAVRGGRVEHIKGLFLE